MKRIKSITSSGLLLILMLLITPAIANEVNSTGSSLIVHGGFSGGSTIFGVVGNSTSRGDLGTGTGTGFHFGSLVSYHMFVIGINYSTVKYSTLEWNEEISGTEYKMKSEGDGRYWSFDLLFGAKLFTESGDMGYTLPYLGYRFWKAVRNQDDVTRNSIPYPAGDIDWDLSGHGWIFGIRDFSTLSLGSFALALQSGIWYYNAPMATLKSNGNEIQTQSEKSAGFGFELGAGIAMEDIGFSVIGGIKIDVQATAFKVFTFDYVAGAGYAQFFLMATYELAF